MAIPHRFRFDRHAQFGTSIQSIAFILALLIGTAQARQVVEQSSGVKSRLRGLCVVNSQIAWTSGSEGTVLLTIDGGKAWTKRPVPNSASLDFRDVHALDARRAWILSIGAGEKSRIYATSDGGATWTLQHQNHDPKVFLDAIAFWDAKHGIVLGDPVDGRYTILITDDGGTTWTKSPSEGMPHALDGEGAFAASGTCLVVQGDRNAWFATGGAKVSRVFRSTDRGRTWSAHETPILAGKATAGIFSLDFRDAQKGVAVGGDYQAMDLRDQVFTSTSDGGRTWSTPNPPNGPSGYRSAVATMPGTTGPTLIAVGPTGADRSDDGGRTWKPWGNSGFHAVGLTPPNTGWAVGEAGRIARITLPVPAIPVKNATSRTGR